MLLPVWMTTGSVPSVRAEAVESCAVFDEEADAEDAAADAESEDETEREEEAAREDAAAAELCSVQAGDWLVDVVVGATQVEVEVVGATQVLVGAT